jgi:hypothetical protein
MVLDSNDTILSKTSTFVLASKIGYFKSRLRHCGEVTKRVWQTEKMTQATSDAGTSTSDAGKSARDKSNF